MKTTISLSEYNKKEERESVNQEKKRGDGKKVV